MHGLLGLCASPINDRGRWVIRDNVFSVMPDAVICRMFELQGPHYFAINRLRPMAQQ